MTHDPLIKSLALCFCLILNVDSEQLHPDDDMIMPIENCEYFILYISLVMEPQERPKGGTECESRLCILNLMLCHC